MGNVGIPNEIRKQLAERIDAFNTQVLKDPDVSYLPRYRGTFLYLDRSAYGHTSPIYRLRYTGTIDRWTFAIFKYSSDRYDPDEWMPPGHGHLDGTVEGVMKAGMEAYPP